MRATSWTGRSSVMKPVFDEARAICDSHAVPLPAAALQFCLSHPVVTTVIPGARTPDELHQTLGWLDTPVPAALWSDLKSAGLLDARAPTPG